MLGDGVTRLATTLSICALRLPALAKSAITHGKSWTSANRCALVGKFRPIVQRCSSVDMPLSIDGQRLS